MAPMVAAAFAAHPDAGLEPLLEEVAERRSQVARVLLAMWWPDSIA